MKKKYQVAIILAMTLLMVFTLLSCSTPNTVPAVDDAAAGSSENTENREEQSEIIIGYSGYSDSFPFSKSVHDGLKAGSDAIGATLLFAENNGDAQTHLKNVDAFITQGANYIVDSCWVVAGVQAAAEKCVAKGIPLISIDILVDDAYFMGASSQEAGEIGGRAAVDYADKNWDNDISYAVLTFSEDWGDDVKKRVSGVVDAIRESGIDLPDDRVLWMDPQSADSTIASKQLATDFLTAHPTDSKIVFATANDEGALGILAAIEASQRSNDCIIVSQDCGPPNINNLHEKEANSWIGSVAYFPEKYGDVIIQMIQDLNSGKTIPQETFMDHVFVDKSNINQYYPE